MTYVSDRLQPKARQVALVHGWRAGRRPRLPAKKPKGWAQRINAAVEAPLQETAQKAKPGRMRRGFICLPGRESNDVR